MTVALLLARQIWKLDINFLHFLIIMRLHLHQNLHYSLPVEGFRVLSMVKIG